LVKNKKALIVQISLELQGLISWQVITPTKPHPKILDTAYLIGAFNNQFLIMSNEF